MLDFNITFHLFYPILQLRKLLFGAIVATRGTTDQENAARSLLLVIYMFLDLQTRPFRRRRENAMDTLQFFCIFVSAVAMSSITAGKDAQTVGDGLAIVLFLYLLFIIIGYFVISFFRFRKQSFNKGEEEVELQEHKNVLFDTPVK